MHASGGGGSHGVVSLKLTKTGILLHAGVKAAAMTPTILTPGVAVTAASNPD